MRFLPSPALRQTLYILCIVCSAAASGLALDREAFTFTHYDLALQLDPGQHRMAVRGKITLRNDTQEPQKSAVLQISSSLDWRAIRSGEQAVEFLTQPYTSDVDHTGGLSEAIVTLPRTVAPGGTVDLDVAYEGVVPLDATRLTRIGIPEDAAENSDWDQISTTFTVLRGAGYVAWYPIATEAANLSEGDSLSEVLARWNLREERSQMNLQILPIGMESAGKVLFNGTACMAANRESANSATPETALDCKSSSMQNGTPTLVVGDYQGIDRTIVEVFYLKGHDAAATTFADAAEKEAPLITNWFGAQREKARVVDLPNPHAAPFESGALLLMSLAGADSRSPELAAAHQLTHASFLSLRPWIEEGLAHFAQALSVERQNGRQAALDYMRLHASSLTELEQAAPPSQGSGSRALADTASEELYRTKAMYVWWMLRDMIGDAPLRKALAAYRSDEDKDSSYMPRLIAAQTQRDLQWFFDDWVYHDRGLPDFKVASVFAEKTAANSFITTVTVDNSGAAGAEVPILVKGGSGTVTQRLVVRAKSKAVIRIETADAPAEVVADDGSVPESDTANNTYKVSSVAH
ncbi:MAG TPA: hypothetical protein VMG31_02600 [Verrucomicrobiae bacterium]|nr:hypothetical protein [Verrucomicrobiae bacterium]